MCIKPYNVRISTVRNRFGGRERISSHKHGQRNFELYSTLHVHDYERKVKQENVSDNQQILNSIHCTYSCLITWMNLLFCSLKNLPVDCSVAIFVCTIEGEGCLTGAAIVAIVAPPDVIRQN